MYSKLARILANIINADVASIQRELPLRGKNGISDMDFARLIIEAEKRFHITIFDIDAANFYVFGDLYNYIVDILGESDNGKRRDDDLYDYDNYFYSE